MRIGLVIVLVILANMGNPISEINTQQALTGKAIAEDLNTVERLWLKTNYCQYCNDGTGTSLGKECDPSIVAVDPGKVPYGTPLFFEGRWHTAGDYCGRAVRESRYIVIDVFHWSKVGHCDCDQLGVEFIEVEVRQ